MIDKNKIKSIILSSKVPLKKHFHLKKIGIFGSYVRDEQTKNSDIDFLIEFQKGKKSYDSFFELCAYLEGITGKPVDVVTQSGLSPYLRPHIEKEIEYYEI